VTIGILASRRLLATIATRCAPNAREEDPMEASSRIETLAVIDGEFAAALDTRSIALEGARS
jgi:hypothetical protein